MPRLLTQAPGVGGLGWLVLKNVVPASVTALVTVFSPVPSVMYQPLEPSASASDPANGRLQTRLITDREQDLWAATSARGWSTHPEFKDLLFSFGQVTASSVGSLSFFAHLDGEPVATGVLCCHQGVALLAGASTIPEARHQGAQRALLNARMQLAANMGCDLAMMCAEPGSTSQRNAERQGFRIAYTRIKWQLASAR